jgi:hypothetical protein
MLLLGSTNWRFMSKYWAKACNYPRLLLLCASRRLQGTHWFVWRSPRNRAHVATTHCSERLHPHFTLHQSFTKCRSTPASRWLTEHTTLKRGKRATVKWKSGVVYTSRWSHGLKEAPTLFEKRTFFLLLGEIEKKKDWETHRNLSSLSVPVPRATQCMRGV